MSRPLLLDLFCCEGGAAVGYHRAGFDVIGVDIVPQPRYPFPMVVADALRPPFDLTKFDAIHASPVCHDWSRLSAVSGRDGTAELLMRTLDMLGELRVPWVVENVIGAPLAHQSDLFGRHGVMLCGTMFGLQVTRHRLFEASFPIPQPVHGSHVGEFYTPAGHGAPNRKIREANPHLRGEGYADRCRAAMGMDWASRDGLAQAIPPAYAAYIGRHLVAHIEQDAA